MEVGMKVGGLDMAKVEDPAGDIIKIITAKVDVALREQALEAYTTVSKVENVIIQNCSIVGDKIVNIDKDLIEGVK